jgi:hypothetical protein
MISQSWKPGIAAALYVNVTLSLEASSTRVSLRVSDTLARVWLNLGS